MQQPEKLFDNFFDDKNIISSRLSNFACDILNRLFADTATLTIRNPGDNASSIFGCLDASPGEAMPATAMEILPGKSHEVKPSQLGPLTNHFLLIHNTSSVNEGAWEVEVVG